MKRIGYLITPEKITTDYCKAIILKAAKFKTKRRNVKKVLNDLDMYADKLKEIVLTGTYKPSPYMVCNVVDQPSGKHRILHKPMFFPDQCIHHILIDLVFDRLMKRLDPYAIASIPGRGIHYGYRAITRWLNSDHKGTKYCLKCDIKKCYDSIRPKYVVASFKKFVKDKKYLSLLRTVAFSMNSLPLGNFTSGWFENILLLGLDTVIRQFDGVSYYLRYVDDFIVLSGNKRKLHKLVAVIVSVLAKIELKLKNNWQVFRVAVRGIDMLGYRFFYGYTLLRKRNLYGLYRVIKNFIKKPCGYWARRVSSRLGSLRWCDSFNLQSMIASKINIIKMRALCSGRTV